MAARPSWPALDSQIHIVGERSQLIVLSARFVGGAILFIAFFLYRAVFFIVFCYMSIVRRCRATAWRWLLVRWSPADVFINNLQFIVQGEGGLSFC